MRHARQMEHVHSNFYGSPFLSSKYTGILIAAQSMNIHGEDHK